LKKDEEGKWYYIRRLMNQNIKLSEEKSWLRTYVNDPKHGKLIGDAWSNIRSYQPKEKISYLT